jgi:hypothetical protein
MAQNLAPSSVSITRRTSSWVAPSPRTSSQSLPPWITPRSRGPENVPPLTNPTRRSPYGVLPMKWNPPSSSSMSKRCSVRISGMSVPCLDAHAAPDCTSAGSRRT